MRVSLIVAVAEGGVIGCQGKLPWHLADDLRRFRRLTTGHAIVMGRRTFASIGRALPGRFSVVITRHPADFPPQEQAAAVASLAGALERAATCGLDPAEVFVIGGAEIYRVALPRADRLYVTRVEAHVPGDTFFPEVNWQEWERISSEPHPADARNDFPVCYEVWDRRAISVGPVI